MSFDSIGSIIRPLLLATTFCLASCVAVGPNPDDPYESINRKVYDFNAKFDKHIVQPPTKLYVAAIPAPIRAGINNIYNNINMLPTVANDLLQADFQQAILDSWRFVINSSMGIGGIFDVASQCQLPPHENDLGITFAKWGDKNSPYVIIPFLGPSTIRDGMGLLFDYTFFTPYPYIHKDFIIESVLILRYIDLRSRMFDTDRLISQAPDPYAFMRDAYLQHRNYLIHGEEPVATGTFYVDEDEAPEPDPEQVLTNDPPQGKKAPEFPITTN
ncbi:MAG: VacJ family lipoprotein [Gammaproteobacteria bacterium]|nr:VacJ family lipoprotein [Gammaproteobacteria bacterium]